MAMQPRLGIPTSDVGFRDDPYMAVTEMRLTGAGRRPGRGGRPVVEYIGDLVHRDDGTLALSVGEFSVARFTSRADTPRSTGGISRLP